MSGGDENASDLRRGAPVDFGRLDAIRERFAAADRFSRIEARPAVAPNRLVCEFDHRFYPVRVRAARLELVWFENGDFSLHYHEDHENGEFDHRWDRYLSGHNTRDHVHPGPTAPTLGQDATHPSDWRDVLSMVVSEIEDRQRAFWET